MTTLIRAKKILWLTLGALLWMASFAQAQTNQGKDFWLAETTNSLAGSADFAIAIANPSGSTANITIEHFGSSDLLDTIPSGGLKTFNFPRLGVCTVGGVNQGKNMVYHVTSDVDVVVYIFNPIQNVYTNDASLVLPVDALGKLHRVGSYVNPNGNTRGSFLGVVAAQDGTNIQVFDRSGTLMNNVTVNKGEYFQRVNGSCSGFNDAVSTDVTGWRVDTSVPAAVFRGVRPHRGTNHSRGGLGQHIRGKSNAQPSGGM